MAIITYTDYATFKDQFDKCMLATANNFVAIGYLLKQARDTDILKESGYSSMGEFARARYGLDETKTSRFIAICERFGNGEDRLIPEYEPYGYAKLSEMLLLPENISEVITPEMTREEIREIKQEIKEEQAISPVEVMLETPAQNIDDSIETAVIKEYLRHRPSEFKQIHELYLEGGQTDYQKIADILAPQGLAMLVQRIQGRGKYMIKISGINDPVTFIDVREEANREIEWKEFSDLIESIFELPYGTTGEEYRRLYGEELVIEVPEEKKKPERIKTEKKAVKKEDKKSKIAPAQKTAEEEPKEESGSEQKEPESEQKEPESEQKEPESEQKEPEIVQKPQKTEIKPQKTEEIVKEPQRSEPVATSQQKEQQKEKGKEDTVEEQPEEEAFPAAEQKEIQQAYRKTFGLIREIEKRLGDRKWEEAYAGADTLAVTINWINTQKPEEVNAALDAEFDND